MSYDTPPRNLAALNQRLKNLEVDETLAVRRRTTMALVVIGQMLPEGAVKGGSAMALRYGSDTRFTRDVDAARTGSLATFRADFEERLREGWGGFSGRLIERKAPKPQGIPAPYVMKPFDVKLDYEGSRGAQFPSNSDTMKSATPTIPSTLWLPASASCSPLWVSPLQSPWR
ncbi:nucleotidyl transferase AbiEii/AbiGii toxin family protein [Paenarthrobacter sp. NPDC090522]|uniref:nucleotidyl transferase AbiEii/AbiGii toxin family protein n=1 Tax=Paenarthrobacter sp. NPDC090522 TaxID=3364383 RepID=UPI0038049048